MSMFNKLAFDIISEAAEAENFNVSSIFDSDVDAEFGSLYNDIKNEIDSADLSYPAESIPVLAIDRDYSEDCTPYCVEFDMLAKYMVSNGELEIDKAMIDIAQANDIQLDELSLLIDSEDDVAEYLEEAKKIRKATGNKKKLDSAYNTAAILKYIKTKGIKVAKKKSGGKKKTAAKKKRK